MAELHTTINGEHVVANVDPNLSLASFLRENLYLTGTKIGCGKGECGACTVIMDGKAVTSCIVPVMRAEGAQIQTIEGLEHDGRLHPLQEEFVNKGAVQCGFCTPGMIMSAKALLDTNPAPSKLEIREALGGNICRCTGYVNIEQAVEAAAVRLQEGER
ncbi:(2Fe-2S)-binding protein [Oscillospiraceae bacterium]|nr:(2Fe-2S)-binding protein [Oscillospiraceae bacterium]BDF76683.1 (2Fe-2S)-binding protein [Oscillospiraceae bacterium]